MKNNDLTIKNRIGLRDEDKIEGSELEGLEQIARWMDDLIRIPILNIRIGLDPILGAIPWLGDAATAVFSIYLIGSALFYDVPKVIILRMALNVVFDYVVGVIPFIGDASDFFIKSNKWNMALLRRYARDRRKPKFSDYLFVLSIVGALLLMIAGGVLFVIYSLKAAGKLW